MGNKRLMSVFYVLVCIVSGALLSLYFSNFINLQDSKKIMTVATAVTVAKGSGITYNPPKPEEAPQDIREAVILGYNILTDTPKYAPTFSGNKLSCTNCHFNSGISESGKNGGLSLVGVGAKYPLYRDRQKYSVDMVLWVSDCFERSMNGIVPAVTSKEMQSVLAYLQWISKDIPIYNEVPWLKTLTIKSNHKGNTETGRQVFDKTVPSVIALMGLGQCWPQLYLAITPIMTGQVWANLRRWQHLHCIICLKAILI